MFLLVTFGVYLFLGPGFIIDPVQVILSLRKLFFKIFNIVILYPRFLLFSLVLSSSCFGFCAF